MVDTHILENPRNSCLRAAKPAEVCVVKFLVKFDLEVDLKFEISDGKEIW